MGGGEQGSSASQTLLAQQGTTRARWTPEELGQFPPWLRDVIRSTPMQPPGPPGPQFDPKLVPIIPGSPAGQLYYEPMLGSGNVSLLAQNQTINEQQLAEILKRLGYGGQV
jgi:hypothetical protein